MRRPGAESLGDSLGGGTAHLAVGQDEAAEGDVESDRGCLSAGAGLGLSAVLGRGLSPVIAAWRAGPLGQAHLDRRGELVEQARPGRGAGDGLLGEDLLLGF